MAKQETIQRVVNVARSKNTGKLFLYLVKKNGDRAFVNLVKDHKGYKPEMDDKAKMYSVTFESCKEDEAKHSITLFGVSDFVKVE
jgi:hypothetical protein